MSKPTKSILRRSDVVALYTLALERKLTARRKGLATSIEALEEQWTERLVEEFHKSKAGRDLKTYVTEVRKCSYGDAFGTSVYVSLEGFGTDSYEVPLSADGKKVRRRLKAAHVKLNDQSPSKSIERGRSATFANVALSAHPELVDQVSALFEKVAGPLPED